MDISTAKLENYVFQDTLSAGFPLQLLQNRPDVKAAELNLRAKNANADVSQKLMYLSLNIDLGGGVNSMLVKNWFDIPGSLFGSVIGGITQPVFNKKKLKTNHEIALLERDKAEIELQRTINNAITEVTDALVILNSLNEELEISKEQVETSTLAVQQSNQLLTVGLQLISKSSTHKEARSKMNCITTD